MKKISFISFILAAVIVCLNTALVGIQAADGAAEVQWEQGTILAASGENSDNKRVVRTKEYLNIADYRGLTLNAGHYITYFVYDADHKYLGNGSSNKKANFLLSGEGVSTAEMLIRYPGAAFFRIAMWRGESGNMTVANIKSSGVKFLGAESDPVFWEMGSIYAKNGVTFVRDQVIRTVGYLPVSEYEGFTINKDFTLSFLAYDSNLKYLGNGNPEKTGYFLGSGVTVAMADIVRQYPTTKYVKMLFRAEPIADITMKAVTDSGVRAYKKGEQLPLTTYTYNGLGVNFDMKLAYGALNVESGVWNYDESSMVSSRYILLSEITRIEWNEDYGVCWCAYDAELKFMGGGKIPTGGVLTRQYILEKYSNAEFLLICAKPSVDTKLSLDEMTDGADIKLYSDIVAENQMSFASEMVVGKSQDGAIYNDTLFLFNSSGACSVYDIKDQSKKATFALDKINILKPHANSVCFGSEFYSDSDPFPLLYVNIYNNYKSESDRREGVCCVYRILKNGSKYSSTLVQVIKIGFVEDTTLWKSMAGEGDRLPYGNFVVDTDENMLYAFVLRDKSDKTRFFKFAMPSVLEGEYDKAYGCSVVTLQSTDVLDMFDVEYFSVIQGCAYSDGKIYSTNGLGSGGSSNKFADLRIVDLKTKTVCNKLDFNDLGISLEPEMIAFNEGGDRALYYLSVDGTLRRLDFSETRVYSAVGQISLRQGESINIDCENIQMPDTQSDAVIELRAGAIYATSVGTAAVNVDGVAYLVTVSEAGQTTGTSATDVPADSDNVPDKQSGCGGAVLWGFMMCVIPTAAVIIKKDDKNEK